MSKKSRTVGASAVPQEIPLGDIRISPLNRKRFDEKRMTELADSIRSHGVLQPIIVRPLSGSGFYEIVFGERRWRAATLAGLRSVPAFVKVMDDRSAHELRIIENVHREDVSPIEEAEAYQALLDLGGYDVAGVAEKLGVQVSFVRSRLALNRLIPRVREALDAELITISHCRIVASLSPDNQLVALSLLIGDQVEGEPVSQRLYSHNILRTISDFRQVLNRSITLEMGKAPWDLADATFEVGACDGCQFRTTSGLFTELAEDDRCTDKRCWSIKLAAHVERRKAALEASGGPVVLLSGDYHEATTPEAIPSKSWDEVRIPKTGPKSDEEAFLEWLASEEREEFYVGPKTFEMATAIGRDRLAMEYPDADELAEALKTFEIDLEDEQPSIEINADDETWVIYRGDSSPEWPGNVVTEEAPEIPEGVVRGLVVDGYGVGHEKWVRLSGTVDAKDLASAELAARKEQIRMQRAEMIARRGMFDAILAAIDDHGESKLEVDMRRWVRVILPAIAIKMGRLSGNTVGDTQDPAKHPGRDVWFESWGLKPAWEERSEQRDPEAIKNRSLIVSLKSTFTAATYDEIHIEDNRVDPTKQPKLILDLFADLFEIDVATIRRDAEFSTLSKKAQAARLKALEEVAA